MDKRLILHDLGEEIHSKLINSDNSYQVFSAMPAVRPCLGCFACWVKTPGKCIIADRGQEFLSHMVSASEIIVISKMCYGSLSADIKAIIDRSIGYILPFFRVVEDETHHKPRYKHKLSLKFVMYGEDITEAEKLTAKKICRANALNFDCEEFEIQFVGSAEDALEVFK